MDYKLKFHVLVKYLKNIERERPSFDDYIRNISDLCKELLEVEKVILWMYDEENQKLVAHQTDGSPRKELPSNTGIIGKVIESGNLYIVNETCKDPYYNPEVDAILGFKNCSSIYSPLKHSNNAVFGAIQVVNKVGSPCFDDEDDEMLLFVSLYCEETLTSYFFEDELIDLQNDIVFLLAELGESRSKETAMHVKRVSAMCEHLATLAGFDQKDLSLIKLASPLHDIGKVGIPDSILQKPGRLDDNEFNTMKKHTLIGHRTLVNLHRKLLRAADAIAYEHHEKYDGTGYPRGLKGEEIHPYARITAICDVFDALANKRVYKPAWPREDVVNEFEKELGKHFDPVYCRIFLDHIDEFYEIIAEFPD